MIAIKFREWFIHYDNNSLFRYRISLGFFAGYFLSSTTPFLYNGIKESFTLIFFKNTSNLILFSSSILGLIGIIVTLILIAKKYIEYKKNRQIGYDAMKGFR
ncbi:MAG: hypothetical protein LBJ93_04115 [Clostridiales bacterium]|jgi:hypothetical protein|nr:hypothetical protein [Clostridiales bacterium]